MRQTIIFFIYLLSARGVLAQNTIRAVIKPYQNRPTIFINGKPQAPLIYALCDVPGGRRSLDEVPQHNLRQYCNDGIRLYQADVFLEQVWQPDGQMDLRYAREQVQGILQACPNAAVFLRFHLNAPPWWRAAHPAENTAYDGTDPGPDMAFGLARLLEGDPRFPQRTSLASSLWQETAAAQLARFCRLFGRTREGRHVAGIQVADGVYGEWHYWGFLKWEADFGPAMTQRFRDWLRARYGTDVALQTAWADSTAQIETAQVPNAERRGHTVGMLRDPQRDRCVVDYYACQHETVADAIIRYCATVKKHWPRPVLTGAFYGYFFACFDRHAAGGHLALQKVLAAPQVDYLAGPQAYLPQAEKIGDPYRSRSLLLSIRLHNKLWLDEMDQQPRRVYPFLGGTRDQREKYNTALAENVAQLRRNLLFAHTKGTGLWLYDFGPAGLDLNREGERSSQHGVTGYWDHPDYHRAIREIKTLFDSTLHRPYRSNSDVLLVYDTEALFHTRSTVKKPDSLSLQLIDHLSLALYQSGVLFDPVHLDDLPLVDFSLYKAVILANTFVLDTTERRFLQNKVAQQGRHLIWLAAPGFSDGQHLSESGVSATVGMQLVRVDTLPGHRPSILLDSIAGDSIVERGWGNIAPLWAVSDSQAIAYGHFRQGSSVALARKNFPNYTTWYASIPLIKAESWRFLLRETGAHGYTEQREIVYGGSGFLVLHTKSGGPTPLRLRNGQRLIVPLPQGPATVLLDAETGQIR